MVTIFNMHVPVALNHLMADSVSAFPSLISTTLNQSHCLFTCSTCSAWLRRLCSVRWNKNGRVSRQGLDMHHKLSWVDSSLQHFHPHISPYWDYAFHIQIGHESVKYFSLFSLIMIQSFNEFNVIFAYSGSHEVLGFLSLIVFLSTEKKSIL